MKDAEKSFQIPESIVSKGVPVFASRYNTSIVEGLIEGAKVCLMQYQVPLLDLIWVPGAFELPLAIQRYYQKNKNLAAIALGAVIQGETSHFDYVCQGVTQGISRVSLDCSIPVAFGILTTQNLKQAEERSLGSLEYNKGYEAAATVLEMLSLLDKF